MTALVHRGRAKAMGFRRRVFAPWHDLRAGVWATREVRRLRGALARDGIQAAVSRPPRRTSRNSGRAVMLATRLARATCLERSLLRQAWLRGRGTMRDVVIGVRFEDQFEAHAWLDGDPDSGYYVEIHRIQA